MYAREHGWTRTNSKRYNCLSAMAYMGADGRLWNMRSHSNGENNILALFRTLIKSNAWLRSTPYEPRLGQFAGISNGVQGRPRASRRVRAVASPDQARGSLGFAGKAFVSGGCAIQRRFAPAKPTKPLGRSASAAKRWIEAPGAIGIRQAAAERSCRPTQARRPRLSPRARLRRAISPAGATPAPTASRPSAKRRRARRLGSRA